MEMRSSPRRFCAGIFACVLAISSAASPILAETNSTTVTAEPAPEAEAIWVQHVVQSYQQLQEQQQSMLRAIEQARQDSTATARAIETARQEAEAAAKRNTEALETRLGRIEESVTSQRARELDQIQSSHRFTLIIVGIFAGVGFFGMLFFALFLLRTMNRRTEMATMQPFAHPLAGGMPAAALGAGNTQLISPTPPNNRPPGS